MITGVQAVVLAAATALPFTPPAGWVQMPSSFGGAQVGSTWKGPKSAGGAATFTAVAFPFPGNLQMLTSPQVQAAEAKTQALKTLSVQKLTLCGTPARLMTSRVQAGAAPRILEQEVAVKNGYAYMVLYSRSIHAPAQKPILAQMRSFCPSGTANAPEFTLPAGWTQESKGMRVVGTWMGTQPGQMMTLMRTSQASSLSALYKSAEHQSLAGKTKKKFLDVTMRKRVTMCGFPGMLVGMRVDAGPMPVSMNAALTQGDGTGYVLMYMRMGTAAADPKAMAALQTLCARGASPAPSASPQASATPPRRSSAQH